MLVLPLIAAALLLPVAMILLFSIHRVGPDQVGLVIKRCGLRTSR
ncbi:hypothetical protein [Nonomuraea basaltis]|nr:hypothetical protein [Nonomuraea basaltis]